MDTQTPAQSYWSRLMAQVPQDPGRGEADPGEEVLAGMRENRLGHRR